MRSLSVCAPLVCLSFVFLLDPNSVVFQSSAYAVEPNDVFAQSTLLEAGTLSVSDSLTPGTGTAPNTYLGAFDEGGYDALENLIDENDDGSTFGNDEASGLPSVDVNPDGSIRFIVTGTGDLFFEGEHEETGGYKAFVEVFNAGGSPIGEFAVNGSLLPDVADQHAFADTNWIGATYSINLNNTVDGFTGGDVDFFTFTGLNPGAMFSAETSSVGTIDTMLGWYNDAGTLVAQDDDSGVGAWSLLEGTVPSSGQLTFAVTGGGDDLYLGEHAEQEFYDLQLSIEGVGFTADFDGDGDVDADDLNHPTLGWEARYGSNLDGANFLAWQRQLGSSGASGFAAQAVPEPSCVALAVISFCLLLGRHPENCKVQNTSVV